MQEEGYLAGTFLIRQGEVGQQVLSDRIGAGRGPGPLHWGEVQAVTQRGPGNTRARSPCCSPCRTASSVLHHVRALASRSRPSSASQPSTCSPARDYSGKPAAACWSYGRLPRLRDPNPMTVWKDNELLASSVALPTARAGFVAGACRDTCEPCRTRGSRTTIARASRKVWSRG